MDVLISELVIGGLTCLFVVLWWFYRQRDQESKNSIALLFKKHNKDVEQLNALKLTISSRHYERADLDVKFDKMEETFRTSFRDVGTDIKDMGKEFDQLNNTLIDYISRHNGNVKQ